MSIVERTSVVLRRPEPERMEPDARVTMHEASAGIRMIDTERVSPEVILAHDFSEEDKRELFFASERYRLLCTRVLQVSRSTKSRVFLITSAISGEGKTLTSANLAFGLSSVEGKRILLVELDLRRPALHRLLGIRPQPGDCVFLEKAGDWHDCRLALRPNLHVMLTLNPAERPDELLHSDNMQRFVEEARREYDIILMDCAPLLVAVDTHVLVSMADQALLVVRADRTPIGCARDALQVLGTKALGCVLNDAKHLKYEEYYRSYYGEEKRK